MLRSNLAVTTALGLIMLISTGSVFAKQQENQPDVSNYAYEILANTEAALNNIAYLPDESLSYVTSSLDLIEKIESSFNQNTSTETNMENKSRVAVSHTHYLPKLDLVELHNDDELRTLKQKIKADILYEGDIDAKDRANHAWFDYTFAKASLVSVREALNADHSVEAIRNLKRVFEAVYIAPDFNVSEQSL